MIKLLLPEPVADDVFDILNELVARAKEDGNHTIISYVAPIMVLYSKALIDAKPKQRKRPLIKSKGMRQ